MATATTVLPSKLDLITANEQVEMEWLDTVVIVIYFVVVLAVGLGSSFWAKTQGSVSGFFLAGRSMNWLLVGASLFGSNIGSGHFVGLAGSAAAGGIAVAGFELNAAFVLIALGWLFVPVYITSGVSTMPEYIKKRFGGQRIRVYLSVLALLLSIFTKVSVDLFAGAIFINQSFKLPIYVAIGILLFVACLFTTIGGLTAVIWTDAIQVLIMIIGAFVLMVKSFSEVGGYNQLVAKYMTSVPQAIYTKNTSADCAGFPREDAMSLLRDWTKGDLPWTGMTFGLTVSAVWYWCSDQVIVQRALSAKNYSNAKGGCVFAAWLKFLPMFLLIFPGMAARVLYTDQIGCTDPDVCEKVCKIRNGCTNTAYPLMVIKLLGSGMRGLMLSCMLSALMSSLTSIFNSSSAIFTIDIYKAVIRKKAGEMEQLIVGKLFVVAMVAISVLWIPIIIGFSSSQLFNYIQSVTSYLAPPVCAVYVLAIFVPRVNEPGAFFGLMMGLVVGLVRFALEIWYTAPGCGEPDLRPWIVAKVHFLHFGIFLFLVSVVVTLVVSLITPPIEEKHQHRLTFWSRFSDQERISLADVDELKARARAAAAVTPIDATGPAVFTIVEPTKGANETNGPEEPKSLCHKIMSTICGLEKSSGTELSDAELQQMKSQFISLDEEPFWYYFWNVNAVLVMAVAVFLYVFYY